VATPSGLVLLGLNSPLCVPVQSCQASELVFFGSFPYLAYTLYTSPPSNSRRARPASIAHGHSEGTHSLKPIIVKSFRKSSKH